MRLKSALRGLLPKGPIVRFLLVGVDNAKPGSSPIKPANGFVVWTRIYLRNTMSSKWFPTKKEIENWLHQKFPAFVA